MPLLRLPVEVEGRYVDERELTPTERVLDERELVERPGL